MGKPTATAARIQDLIAQNFVAAQERGGLRIEIARLLFARTTALPHVAMDLATVAPFTNVTVIGEVIFRVTNTTDVRIAAYPDQGTMVVNGEQIALTPLLFAGACIGRTVGGDFLPGDTVSGGLWFPVTRTDVPAINQVIIAIDAPHDADYEALGDDYYFEIDLSDHVNEPFPEELA